MSRFDEKPGAKLIKWRKMGFFDENFAEKFLVSACHPPPPPPVENVTSGVTFCVTFRCVTPDVTPGVTPDVTPSVTLFVTFGKCEFGTPPYMMFLVSTSVFVFL